MSLRVCNSHQFSSIFSLRESLKAFYTIISPVISDLFPQKIMRDILQIISPAFFNLFLRKIMQDTLHYHHSDISNGGRNPSNMCSADSIELLRGQEREISRTGKRKARNWGMSVSTDKSHVMVSSMDNINTATVTKSHTLHLHHPKSPMEEAW